MKLDILYEDDDLIAINKPAHLLTIPDRFKHDLPSAKSLLARRCTEIYTVHRLDRETSGAIVFAKTAEAHRHLNDQFVSGEVDKSYLTLCITPREDSGHIDNFLAESEQKPGVYVVAKKGKRAISDYHIVENYGKYALVSVRIHTGRTHQIRVHMRNIKAPLIVDSKYGVSDAFYLSQIKKIKRSNQEERPLLHRSALHSHILKIKSPSTDQLIEITAPLPKDMRAVVNQMRKVLGVK